RRDGQATAQDARRSRSLETAGVKGARESAQTLRKFRYGTKIEEILMSASTAATTSTSVYTTPLFWERLWRSSGIQSAGLFVIAYFIYGYQPQIGAPTDALVAFYDGERTRILIAAIFSGLAILNLMWFAAALRTTLADAGQDGWGAAATA